MNSVMQGVDDGLQWFKKHGLQDIVDSIDTDGPTFFLRDIHIDDPTSDYKLHPICESLKGASAEKRTYSNRDEQWRVQFPTWALVWNVIHPPVSPKVVTEETVQL